jgi:isocitrate dehydrogenase
VNDKKLAAAFSKVLNRPMKAKPVVPSFVLKVIAPVVVLFSHNMKDMYEMIKWVGTGVYVSKNTERQKQLFGDLPTIEEGLRRYSKDNKLIA